MYCRNCGNQLEDNARFCPNCGSAQSGAAPQQPVINVINQNTNVNGNFGYIHKRKWVAFFLCLFLGEFGFHRFYVGKVFSGIIWLLTLGLFGIGWILDLIVILFGGFHDKAGQPLL